MEGYYNLIAKNGGIEKKRKVSCIYNNLVVDLTKK